MPLVLKNWLLILKRKTAVSYVVNFCQCVVAKMSVSSVFRRLNARKNIIKKDRAQSLWDVRPIYL